MRSLIIVIVAVGLGACRSDARASRSVLFIGNSYIYFNDLPDMFASVVTSAPGAPPVGRVESVTMGGWRLSQHAEDARTDGHVLSEFLAPTGPDWTHVVVQEHSQIPGLPMDHPHYRSSLDAMSELARLIGSRRAKIVLFLTWGRRTGDPANPDVYPDYPMMQARLQMGYEALAEHASMEGVEVYVAPVGLAFSSVRTEDSQGLFRRLYQSDGSHPSVRGSYLAACVLAATTFGVDPMTVTWKPSGMSEQVARKLRGAAASALD